MYENRKILSFFLHIWESFCLSFEKKANLWFLIGGLVVVFFIIGWLIHYRSNDATIGRIGKQGETKVKKILKRTKSCKKRILNNVILQLEYGNTTQIDHILINEYGVFVIETKNYKGVVYGTEGKHYWQQYLKNKSFTFYNPIKQNEAHIQHLKEIFGKTFPYYSIIVFAGTSVKKIDSDIVFSLSELGFYLDSFTEKMIQPKDINALYRAIRSTQRHKWKTNRRHLHNMKKNQSKFSCSK